MNATKMEIGSVWFWDTILSDLTGPIWDRLHYVNNPCVLGDDDFEEWSTLVRNYALLLALWGVID